MELYRETQTNIDVTSARVVLTYTYSGTTPREVIVRVDAGDASKPIAGAGTYQLSVLIDDVLVVPEVPVNVPAGRDKVVLISRTIAIEAGDVLKIQMLGQPTDTGINVISSVRDVTPITVADVRGPGTVAIDHNYGGTDNLSYKTSGGAGVINATVTAFTTSDYNAGNRGEEFRQGFTYTVEGGQWAGTIGLSPGTYTLVYEKAGAYGPNTQQLIVS